MSPSRRPDHSWQLKCSTKKRTPVFWSNISIHGQGRNSFQSFASVSWSVHALSPRCDLAQARQNHCDNSPSTSATELRILWGEVRIAEKAQAAECSSPGRHKPKARQNYEKPDSSYPIVLLSNLPSTKERMNINKKII